MSSSPLHSMTGFTSTKGTFNKKSVRIELKSLNHRFLDVKLRLPKELHPLEHSIRDLLRNSFSRGAIEFKIEILPSVESENPEFKTNLSVAAHYYENLIRLQKTLGLNDAITLRDVLAFPDVISKEVGEEILENPEASWDALKPLIDEAISALKDSRKKEGESIETVLTNGVNELASELKKIDSMRILSKEKLSENLKDKIGSVFEAHPVNEPTVKSVLENRIAQELAIILDRIDVEEEINRFDNHLSHFKKTLAGGSPIGRKLDFILQEMNREANTLGNKAQEFEISNEIVQVKVKVEQLREQVMNVE